LKETIFKQGDKREALKILEKREGISVPDRKGKNFTYTEGSVITFHRTQTTLPTFFKSTKFIQGPIRKAGSSAIKLQRDDMRIAE
jgi:hypothetical protein